MSTPYILVVDDEPDIRELVKDILEDEGFQVATAEHAQAARDARRARRPDLILLDIWMPGTDGISLLKEWGKDKETPTPVIMMSGHGTVETAVEATRLGAYDFIEKPLSMAKLLITVRRGLESAMLRQENIGLRQQTPGLYELLGRSGVMNSLREQARRYAEHSTAILISGESGSGKSILARYIHSHSQRRGAPFIQVPATSLSSARSAANLFGVERGEKLHFGSLEQANGGSIFLEDIIDMNLDVQARLLSALSQGSYVRVGGVDPVPADMRIIAACGQDLTDALNSGRLRDDLYYHLNVLPLEMPPLRDHREDIPELVEHFVDQLVTLQNLPYRHFGVAAQNQLRYYAWPGNVRELKNVVQRMLILGSTEEVTTAEVELALGSPAEAVNASHDDDFNLPLKEAREEFERRYLEQKIREENGNISKVAERVGLERTHLYRKFKSLKLDPKQILNKDE